MANVGKYDSPMGPMNYIYMKHQFMGRLFEDDSKTSMFNYLFWMPSQFLFKMILQDVVIYGWFLKWWYPQNTPK